MALRLVGRSRRESSERSGRASKAGAGSDELLITIPNATLTAPELTKKFVNLFLELYVPGEQETSSPQARIHRDAAFVAWHEPHALLRRSSAHYTGTELILIDDC
eukprot:557157-Pleurochrysis_carterae.AAC.2